MKTCELSPDGLSRKVWEISMQNESYLVLTFYAEQKRESKRHGWKGPSWGSTDERTATLDRPTSVPEWVVQHALKTMVFKVAIGWSNPKFVVRETIAS